MELREALKDPYRLALYRCYIRYMAMSALNSEDPIEDELVLFCHEFGLKINRGYPIPKLCRWLGYIQGVLIERGVTTVEEERDWTRPLFRPLDFKE